jgi:peptidyl-prolyl cis-trans isomerase SurA
MQFTVRKFLIALGSCLALAAPAGADEIIRDGIAAQVGPDIVLVSEVLERVAELEEQLREAGAPRQEIARLRAAGLEKLIEARLIDQIVRRGELFATDEEVEAAIASIASENGITTDQLEATVVAQGLAYDDYRDKIKSSIEHQKVIRAVVASKVRVDESEVRALYDERFSDQPAGGEVIHLRQALVTFGEMVPVDPKAVCAPVYAGLERIRAGESFETIASEISEVAPAEGGDIGWLHTDSVASWMRDVVDALKIGETSDVVELPFGCSLLKLVDRRDFEPITYEEAKSRLQQEVYETHIDKEFRVWMEEVRAQTFIERKGHFAEAATLGSQSGYADPNVGAEDSLF